MSWPLDESSMVLNARIELAPAPYQRAAPPLTLKERKLMVLRDRLELSSPGYESGTSPSTLAEHGADMEI